MKRVLVLVGVLLVCAVVSVGTILYVLSSGPQFAKRLNASWRLGELLVVGSQMVDLNTVRFEQVELRELHGFLGAEPAKASLSLANVHWRRAALWSFADTVAIPDSVLRFDSGKLALSHGSRHRGRAKTQRWGVEGGQLPALPSRITGRTLTLLVDGNRDDEQVELRLTDFVMERTPEGVEVRAGLESELWERGILSATERGGRWSLWVHLDDVNLAWFHLESVARLLGFPWSEGFPQPIEGRADLDWRVDDAGSVVELRHFQMTVVNDALSYPVRFLSGVFRATPDEVTWKVDNGRYSQSKLAGAVTVDTAAKRVEGQFVLEDVIGDSGLGSDESFPWPRILEQSPLEGRCDVLVPVSGFLGLGLVEALPSMEFRFQGTRSRARSPADDRDGVDGSFVLTRASDGWSVSGRTAPSQVRGFHLPASTWQGKMTSSGFELRRADPEGVKLDLDVTIASDGVQYYELALQQLDLGAWTGFPGRLQTEDARLHLAGEWHERRGFSYEGWVQWQGLLASDTVEWPVRRPHSEVRGGLFFRRYRGQDYLPAIVLRDEFVLWVARGWIDRNQNWTLDGVAAFGKYPLPSALDVPDLIESPREGWQRYRIRGPLLEWTIVDQGQSKGR